MKVVVQRVTHASVTVNQKRVGQIQKRLVVFVGIGKTDDDKDLAFMANKIIKLRIFEDTFGKMNHCLTEVGGELLVISQFTLFGDVRKGNRPNFEGAMPHLLAQDKFDQFISRLRSFNVTVQTGIFREDMKVLLENDGPVTLLMDSKSND